MLKCQISNHKKKKAELCVNFTKTYRGGCGNKFSVGCK